MNFKIYMMFMVYYLVMAVVFIFAHIKYVSSELSFYAIKNYLLFLLFGILPQSFNAPTTFLIFFIPITIIINILFSLVIDEMFW